MGYQLAAIGLCSSLPSCRLAVLPSCRLAVSPPDLPTPDSRLALLAHPGALFPFGPHPSRGVGIGPGIVDVVLAVGSAGKGAGHELEETVVGATAADRARIQPRLAARYPQHVLAGLTVVVGGFVDDVDDLLFAVARATGAIGAPGDGLGGRGCDRSPAISEDRVRGDRLDATVADLMRHTAIFAATAATTVAPAATAVCDLEQSGAGPATNTVVGDRVVAVDGIAVDAHHCAGRRHGQDAVLPAGTGEDQRVAERLSILG